MKFRLVILTLILISPQLLKAQTGTAVEDEPIPFYDVEVVLFKNLQGPRGVEFSRPSSLPARTENTVEIQSAESVNAANDLGFALLEQDEFRLTDQVAKIVDSSRYELMLHVAWRQPGLGFEQSTPVWIRGGKIYGSEYSSIDFSPSSALSASQIADSLSDPDAPSEVNNDGLVTEQRELDAVPGQNAGRVEPAPSRVTGLYELEGSITVSLARYLHLNADLVLRKPRPVGATQAGFYNTRDSSVQDSRILENHRLQERRRMRSATLHYLDNPQFSMLVIISPYEAEVVNVEAVSATALTE